MPLQRADTVVPERVRWYWPGYLPFGKVSVLDGDPGLGKSCLLIDLAARSSRGEPLPNGKTHRPMPALLLMGEDAAADTIVPRLMNAGADLNLIAIRDTYPNDQGREITPGFPSDLDKLEADLREVRPGLVVIDPIMSYLDPDINSNNDQQVRRALLPLAQLADESGAAIVLLRHLNKSGRSAALYRGGGSIGFVGVARSALIVARDPDDPSRVVLASNKSNLGPPPPSLHYRLEGCANGQPRLAWGGHSSHTAETLMREQDQDDRGSALDEAVAFLTDLLDGGPELATAVQRAAREAGLAWDTVRRAQRRLKIVPEKAKTQDGKWSWALPVEGVAPRDDHNNNINNNFNIFEGYREDVEVVEGVEAVEVRNTNTFKPARNWPIVAKTGRYECANHCGRTRWMAEGEPQLCHICWTGLGGRGAVNAD